MDAADRLADLEEARRRDLIFAIVLSALGHALAVAAIALSPSSPRSALPPRGIVSVELIDPSALAPAAQPAAPARPAPPAPAPPPEPEPEPVKLPPQKPVETTVLPEQPTGAMPKPKPKPKPRPKPRAEPPPPPEQVDYDELLAELRAERGEPPAPTQTARAEPGPARPGTETGAASAPAGSPRGVIVDREHAAWIRRAKAHVHRSWIVPPGFRTQRLKARVEVDLDAAGGIIGEPRLVEGSGNRHYDRTALRALAKASPLPPPPEAGEWTFLFDTEDLY